MFLSLFLLFLQLHNIVKAPNNLSGARDKNFTSAMTVYRPSARQILDHALDMMKKEGVRSRR